MIHFPRVSRHTCFRFLATNFYRGGLETTLNQLDPRPKYDWTRGKQSRVMLEHINIEI